MRLCSLTAKWFLLSFFTYAIQDHPPREWCHLQWAGSSHINQQAKQSLTDMPTGQPDLGNSAIQATFRHLGTGKWRKQYHHRRKQHGKEALALCGCQDVGPQILSPHFNLRGDSVWRREFWKVIVSGWISVLRGLEYNLPAPSFVLVWLLFWFLETRFVCVAQAVLELIL